MYRLAAIALALVFAPTAAIATVPTLPLTTPPVESNPTANQIFDAMMAISRIAASNPQAAQRASFSYQAAIQQYQAGDTDRARQSAVQAIAQTAAPAFPTNGTLAPVNGPTMPLLRDDPQAEMEARLGLARRALTNCGATTSEPFTSERRAYDGAVQNLLARQADDLNHAVQGIVDRCAATMAGQSAPSIPAH
jgi:hypothetical protein